MSESWYKEIYSKIVERAKTRGLNKSKLIGYYEKHHIIPRCLGGTNEDDNLCLLTYREHIICHIILVKLNPGNVDLIRAVSFMFSVTRFDPITGEKIIITLKNSRIAEEFKLKAVELNRGENSPSFGRKLTDEHKKILSKANSYKRSEETKEKMRRSQLGKKHTEETKEKLSKIHKGLKIHTEEHKVELSNRWKMNNPRKNMDMSGKNNPSSKKIITPEGKIYESIKLCSKGENISYDSLRNWVKNCPEKGYKLI